MNDVLKGACLALLVILLMTAYVEKARSHDWYDAYCCSNADCKPIDSCAEFTEQKDGSVKWDKFTFEKRTSFHRRTASATCASILGHPCAPTCNRGRSACTTKGSLSRGYF